MFGYYKCWVYVLKVIPTDSFYIGYTSDLKTRLDAHRKGRGHKATSSGQVKLIETVECHSGTARLTEKRKTLEYIEKYGRDRVVGHVFAIKRKSGTPTSKESKSPIFIDDFSSLIYDAEREEGIQCCGECIHFDNPDHCCMLLGVGVFDYHSCPFWSSGTWGETRDEIAERAKMEAESWFTEDTPELVKSLFQKGCYIDQIRKKVFPSFDQRKPYTAYSTQKKLVDNFILTSLGFTDEETKWEKYKDALKIIHSKNGGSRYP